MTKLLEAVTTDGTARGMSLKELSGIAVAGKTGTTQNNCDRWFVGYTPRLLCGVWMGYDYPTPLDGIDGNPCVTIFDEVISACEAVYQRKAPQRAFDTSPRVIPVKICPLSGEIATPEGYEAMNDLNAPQIGWFIEGTEPRDACHLHFVGWESDTGEPTEETEPEEAADGSETVTQETETESEKPWFWRLLP